MKSVGEVMAIGRTFKESIQKALCSLEKNYGGFERLNLSKNELIYGLRNGNEKRILQIAQAFSRWVKFRRNLSIQQIDRWFLNEISRDCRI